MKDPIVDEVRQTRLKIEQECAKAGIFYKDHLLAVQKRYENRLVIVPAGDSQKKELGKNR
ncbi:MAG: hypothetical protein A2511_08350 [Deltaproteobacteria bacterium RIFOXYD12_FULL_50_9]|nr:MAG: hypothetical protein A2511_08350 [Deltaproteobacteria bacterium RIFOXYD12_FULL_50_9]